MVHNAFVRADEFHAEAAGHDGGQFRDFQGDVLEETVEVNMTDMENLVEESAQPVYEGCGINRLQARIVFMNMANLYGVMSTFMDELLSFVVTDLLPQANCLPRNTYNTKKMLIKMGLEHEAIYCCPDGHILYEWPEFANLMNCPKCKVP